MLLATPCLSACVGAEDRKVFTWISHPVDKATAQWLQHMGFTDVCVRYVSLEQAECSKENLNKYGLTFWWWIDPFTLQGNIQAELEKRVSQSSSGNILIDDCHFLHENMNNVLAAVENVTTGNILLTFYQSPPDYNLSKFDIDLYMMPSSLNETLISDTVKNVKSLGLYLWVWQGHGVSWHTLNHTDVLHVYQTAEKYGLQRLCVWMGNESDNTERGMWNSSLINFPEWWPIIETYNHKFRTAPIISEKPVWFILPLTIFAAYTICSRYRNPTRKMTKSNTPFPTRWYCLSP